MEKPTFDVLLLYRDIKRAPHIYLDPIPAKGLWTNGPLSVAHFHDWKNTGIEIRPSLLWRKPEEGEALATKSIWHHVQNPGMIQLSCKYQPRMVSTMVA